VFRELTTTLEARFSSFADNLQDLRRAGLFPFDSEHIQHLCLKRQHYLWFNNKVQHFSIMKPF